MNYKLIYGVTNQSKADAVVVAVYQKSGKADSSSLSKDQVSIFQNSKSHNFFSAAKGETDSAIMDDGTRLILIGMGDKSKVDFETIRKQISNVFKSIQNKFSAVCFDADSFTIKNNSVETAFVIREAIGFCDYEFDRHKSVKRNIKLKNIEIHFKNKGKAKAQQAAVNKAEIAVDSVHFTRDLVNESPNYLNSETFAKIVEKDAKTLKRVKTKVLGKKELEKEKMGMFLSVNAGSAYGPRLVHLTYTPAKVTSKTKHVALVGKGLTFDTGGYSLKPPGSMINMKFDMAGAATMYGAFRAAVKMNANVKISCFLGMTDNAINSEATFPDSIVTARNGMTVEVLNTDAEGRLVLGDVLSYACDQDIDEVIDAATLTGACLVAVGHEVCAVLGNDQDLVNDLLKSSSAVDEYMWQLPIIDEHKEDMKSQIADLKNIGSTRFGGTAKAAAFLANFVTDDVCWSHLDIAGIGDSQGHLPYCPKKGSSGLIVRSLTHYLTTTK
jgi:leucyl aminopeptidase